MYTKLSLLIFISFFFTKIQAQDYSWEWAATAGGTSNDFLIDLGNDLLGNVYVLGSFTGEFMDFTPEKRLINRMAHTNYIAKYNSNGGFEWVKGIYGKGLVRCIDFQVDEMGNCYVGGEYNGEYLKLGEDVQIDNVGDREQSEVNTFDMFVAKFNSDGEAEWARSYGGKNNDAVLQIELDLEDNLYAITAGAFKPAERKGKGKIDFNIQLKALENNINLIKLDADGKHLWNFNLGYASEVKFKDMAITDEGICYLTGTFQGDHRFMGNHRIRNMADAYANIGNKPFLLKVATDGNLEWVDVSGGNHVEVDEDGNIYLLGNLGENAFNELLELIDLRVQSSDGENLYVAKYTPDGKGEWFKTFGSLNGSFTKNFKRGADGLIYTLAYFENDCYFGEFKVPDYGLHLVAIDQEGNFEKVIQRIEDEDQSNEEDILQSLVKAMEVNEFGEIYLGGIFRSEYFFLAGKRFINKGRVGKRNDIFISKLVPE